MRFTLIYTLIIATGLAGCSFPGVYKRPVEQGNVLLEERIERLEVGMSRDQVQFLLGSPITVNSFNPDRWVYLAREDFDGNVRENQYLIVVFKNETVAAIERETGASPSDPLSRVDTTPVDRQDSGSWWWPF